MEAVALKYDYRDLVDTGVAFTGLEIEDAGSNEFFLPNEVLFFSTDFTLNTAVDESGTNITGFDFIDKNDFMTTKWGQDVYEKIKITDVTYQTGKIYAFGDVAGSDLKATDMNRLQLQIAELISGTSALGIASKHTFFTYKDRSIQGLLAYTHDSFSQANYPELFAEIGHLFNDMHVQSGGADLSASGTLFYATPIPGYYERGGTQDTAVIDSTADVDDATELITLATADYDALHMTRGVLGTGADGVPVRLKLVSGALPTGLAEDTTYFINFGTTPDISLHTTEALAIAGTSAIGLTDAVGTFKITQEGVYFDDAFKEHTHVQRLWSALGTGGNIPIGFSSVGAEVTGPYSTLSAGDSNETRPKTFISFGYIKAEHITTAGEPVSALRYDTGWVSNSDWTNVQFSVNHALSANLSDLIVKLFLSTDGTDANSFEIPFAERGLIDLGLSIYQVDTNNIEIQTGSSGFVMISNTTGLTNVVDTETWYYKVVITKPNLVATYADTSFRKVFDITTSTDETFTLPDASTTLTEHFIKRRGAGSGVVNFATVSSQTINGNAASTWGLKEESDITLIPSGGNWEVKDMNGFRFHVQDQKTAGTDGGTFTAGAWQTRDLNTEVENSLFGPILTGNQITNLLAGRYKVYASATSYQVNRNQTRLQNITDPSTEITGRNTSTSNGDATVADSILIGSFTITGTKVLELQHQCQITKTTIGYGLSINASFTVDHETYSDLVIKKVG